MGTGWRRMSRAMTMLTVVMAVSACGVLGPEAELVMQGGGGARSPTRAPTATLRPPTPTPRATPSVAPTPTMARTFIDDDCLCPALGPSDRTVESLARVTNLTCRYRWNGGEATGVVEITVPRRIASDDPDGSRSFQLKRDELAGWNAGKQGATTHWVEEPRRVTGLTRVDDTKALDYGWRYGLRVAQMKGTAVTLRVNAKGLADEAAVIALLDRAEACALQAIDAYDAR